MSRFTTCLGQGRYSCYKPDLVWRSDGLHRVEYMTFAKHLRRVDSRAKSLLTAQRQTLMVSEVRKKPWQRDLREEAWRP